MSLVTLGLFLMGMLNLIGVPAQIWAIGKERTPVTPKMGATLAVVNFLAFLTCLAAMGEISR